MNVLRYHCWRCWMNIRERKLEYTGRWQNNVKVYYEKLSFYILLFSIYSTNLTDCLTNCDIIDDIIKNKYKLTTAQGRHRFGRRQTKPKRDRRQLLRQVPQERTSVKTIRKSIKERSYEPCITTWTYWMRYQESHNKHASHSIEIFHKLGEGKRRLGGETHPLWSSIKTYSPTRDEKGKV